jgi:hypothetical protein
MKTEIRSNCLIKHCWMRSSLTLQLPLTPHINTTLGEKQEIYFLLMHKSDSHQHEWRLLTTPFPMSFYFCDRWKWWDLNTFTSSGTNNFSVQFKDMESFCYILSVSYYNAKKGVRITAFYIWTCKVIQRRTVQVTAISQLPASLRR